PQFLEECGLLLNTCLKERPLSIILNKRDLLALYSGDYKYSTGMRKEEKIVPHAACVLLPARPKPSPWKEQSASPVKSICTARKNMQPNTRSICCAVFFVVCARKPVLKMPCT